MVVGHPACDEGDECGGERDLLGASAGQGDAQVGGAVPVIVGAVAAGFAAAQPAYDEAAAEDVLERRELREGATSAIEQALHSLRLYSRKPTMMQAPLEGPEMGIDLTR